MIKMKQNLKVSFICILQGIKCGHRNTDQVRKQMQFFVVWLLIWGSMTSYIVDIFNSICL